jgi:hypothetical protein
MESKDVSQERHLVLVGLMEVEPEVLAGGYPRLDRGAVNPRYFLALAVDELSAHGSPVILTPALAL